MALRVDQNLAEVIADAAAASALRVDQAVAEIVSGASPALRVDEAVAEVVAGATATLRVNQCVAEIIMDVPASLVCLTQITGGKFQDPLGNPVANGRLMFTLLHDEQGACASQQVVAGLSTTVPLDGNGSVSGAVFMWTNPNMSPAGSSYLVSLFNSSGMAMWRTPQQQSIPASPSPFDLGTWVPS